MVIKQLASWDGQYTFGLQGNRNIVLSRKLATQTVVLWQSNTGVARPQAPLTLVLQQDGNLVGYEGPPGSRTPFWRSGTAGLGAGPYRLALQINQNAVLYDGNGRPLWSTASGEPSSPFYKRYARTSSTAGGVRQARHRRQQFCFASEAPEDLARPPRTAHTQWLPASPCCIQELGGGRLQQHRQPAVCRRRLRRLVAQC